MLQTNPKLFPSPPSYAKKFASLYLDCGKIHFNSFIDGQSEFDLIFEGAGTRLIDTRMVHAHSSSSEFPNLFKQVVCLRSATLPLESNKLYVFRLHLKEGRARILVNKLWALKNTPNYVNVFL